MDDSPPTLLVFEDARHEMLPSWVIMCFTINVIMGSGFLGVPYGFLLSGPLLGTLVVLAVTMLQWLAACLLSQVISRANAVLGADNAADILTPTLTPLTLSEADSAARQPRAGPLALLLPSHTTYEIPMLCRLFIGRWAERLVMLSVSLYLVGSLWSYISVFAASMAAVVPLPGLLRHHDSLATCDIYQTDMHGGSCLTLYYFWVLVFAIAMAVLLALDMREQACFQCTMTALRGCIIALMVLTLLLGERSDFGLEEEEGEVPTDTPETPVRWSGLSTIVLIGVFCQNFQMGVPSLLQPLKQKSDFPKVFAGALACTFIMYTILGLSAVRALGADVDPSCNLNWSSYRIPMITLVVSLFPALDCVSVFPMNAIFLANNLLAVVFQRRWHAGQVGRKTRYSYRFACCVPSFVCAFLFPSLSKALDFTGVVGILLPFIVTPTLFIVSLRACRKKWGVKKFDDAESVGGLANFGCSSPIAITAFAIFGALLFLYTVVHGIVNGF
ncbi:hypothetical protein AB1Y20_001612 [Prymnesium parvum]|uniref:Amino acid transporter transmembrane domain-containing protein n=1 Tax=Prymnesium parvum TaxID=97485 RepID=A0AB34KC58_PRYPA